MRMCTVISSASRRPGWKGSEPRRLTKGEGAYATTERASSICPGSKPSPAAASELRRRRHAVRLARLWPHSVAAQQYYVYLSSQVVTASWQPYLQNYAPNLNADFGSRVAALWLDR
jgi:hypothetical protein